ncbi:hypothetical protein C8035_v004228 [Colletotrichum spinosum]|uniref:Ubiquitin-like domain-containing protein n=1 Tax=Colletotrichum spinosum TaxID=1347390 RepID=A0A4R8PVA0_9PEZI|nr:hypothetical protein C8035_v004228 [Colletotrichum spinosum]
MEFITVMFGGRSRLVARPDSYSALIDKARAGFNISDDICSERLVFSFAPIFLDHEVELDSSAYEAVKNMSSLRLDISDLATPVIGSRSDACKESPNSDIAEDAIDSAAIPQTLTERASKRRRDSVDQFGGNDGSKHEATVTSHRTGGKKPRNSRSLLTGYVQRVSIPLQATDNDLKDAVHEQCNVPVERQRLRFKGKLMGGDVELQKYGIKDNDEIELVLRLTGGKPAIYLSSPTPVDDISVSVALSHHWTFSTIYPLTETRALPGRRCAISWKVSTKANGDLSDYGTGLDCRYLFWEADAVADANALESDVYPFNPQNPKLRRAGSSAFILSFNDFVPYLDRALKSMTLTTEMRTDFVVYWLPALQKIRDRGLDVAFDFVPQANLEKVATLDTKPGPEAVARIFLLFDGVAKGAARSIIDMEGVDWPARIGMDAKAMQNTSLFRVLEWGGMEAKVV